MRYLTGQDLAAGQVRHDYSRDELRSIYQLPLPRLLRIAQTVHEQHWPDDEIQLCTLLSVKTGGCSENCGYCSQSAHHQASVRAHALLDVDSIVTAARAAKANGATRFCMGAAWRSPPKRGNQFEQVLTAVRVVRAEGLEVCTTLGMLNLEEAQALREAGVYAYNHNLDTSPEYYGKVVTTRTYDDRLQTLQNVRSAGMTVCCGGIIGMGESMDDRLGLIEQLTHLNPHPESVPVNLLVRVAGTPLGASADLDVFDLVRTVATCRITMPKSRVRLSAGRTEMRPEAQALCFTAGANSIFLGDKLLTTPNPLVADDHELLATLGMRGVGAGGSVSAGESLS